MQFAPSFIPEFEDQRASRESTRPTSRPITELLTTEDVRGVLGVWRPAQAVIVLYGAKWCRSCKFLKPKVDRLANKVGPSTAFFLVNHHEDTALAFQDARVTTMPTLVISEGARTKMLPANKDTLAWLENALFTNSLWLDEYQM